MELLVDREIVGAESAFSAFGKVRLFSGRELRREHLGAAEALLVRSVSRVDRALLHGSRVQFVGTATSGTDHVDLEYLSGAGVRMVSAAGCNARAVAEHVICCLYRFAAECGRHPSDLTLAIVGFGHVGKAVAALAGRLQIRYVVRDPLLGASVNDVPLVSLEACLEQDVVSVHVPLTMTGEFATFHLIGAEELRRMKPGGLLINAARGGVVDEVALALSHAAGTAPRFAVDCWAGEPRFETQTAQLAWAASPHIAGHTLEARVSASEMMHRALSRWAGTHHEFPSELLPGLAHGGNPGCVDVFAVLRQIYDLDAHTHRVKVLADLAPERRSKGFDEDRRKWGLRREFASHVIGLGGSDAETAAHLRALGFALDGPLLRP